MCTDGVAARVPCRTCLLRDHRALSLSLPLPPLSLCLSLSPVFLFLTLSLFIPFPLPVSPSFFPMHLQDRSSSRLPWRAQTELQDVIVVGRADVVTTAPTPSLPYPSLLPSLLLPLSPFPSLSVSLPLSFSCTCRTCVAADCFSLHRRSCRTCFL